MDACTTSPAESQNNSLKHKSSNVNSRMNLSTSVRKVVDGISDRLERRKSKADRELSQTNMSSQAPTKNYLIKKGQGLADCNFDASLERKSARLGTNHTISWNFELTNDEVFEEGVDVKDIQFARPKFLRVRELHVDIDHDEKCFVQCKCGKRRTIGVPCICFWKLARDADIPMSDIMDVGMFDVRWLKSFNSHFGQRFDGEYSRIAKMLMIAQNQCFEDDGKGTQISQKYMDALLKEPDDVVYPILGKNTTKDDLTEAMWVLDRGKRKNPKATTWMDLMLHTSGTTAFDVGLEDYENPEDMTLHDLSSGMNEYKNLSEQNLRMQEALQNISQYKEDGDLTKTEDIRTYDVRENVRKYTYDLFKSFNEDAKARDQDFLDIKKGIEEVFERQRGVLNRRHGKVGGGKGRLELYGQEGGGCHSPLKKTKYSVKFTPKNQGQNKKRKRRK